MKKQYRIFYTKTVLAFPISQIAATFSWFSCPEKEVLFMFFYSSNFFFADSRREKGFQPVKSLYFCVGKRKKNRMLE